MRIFVFFVLFSVVKSLSFSEAIFHEEFKFGNSLQITLYQEGVYNFSVSNLSSKIVYEFEHFIWMMDADGKNKTKLFQGTNPQFFPDDEVFLYSDNESIYIYDLTDESKTKIVEKGVFPKISPCGNFIAYLNTTSSPNNLFVYNILDETNTQVTDIRYNEEISDFCFLQNKEIAYIVDGEVYVTHINGIISYRLTKGKRVRNIFSSLCGKKIGYIDGDFNLYVKDLVSGRNIFVDKLDGTTLFKEPLPYEENIDWIPDGCFSPSSEDLVVSSYDKKNKKFYLYLYKLSNETKKLGNIIDSSSPIYNPVWTGDRIVYVMAKNMLQFSQKAIFCVNLIKIFINYERVKFKLYPVKLQNEIFVPLQEISDKLNLSLVYNRTKKSIVVSSLQRSIEYQLNISRAIIGNNIVKIGGAPFTVLNDVVYVPLSSLFFILPCEIIFNEKEGVIYITCKE